VIANFSANSHEMDLPAMRSAVAAGVELAHYHGFRLHAVFLIWLQDSEDHISRAAATASVMMRPRGPVASLVEALQSKQATARKNAAWALGALAAPAADSLLQLLNDTDARVEREAFRSAPDYSPVAGLVAGYQLWDRAGEDPTAIIQVLGSSDVEIANRAEWILVKAGPAVLPAVRQALSSEMKSVRERGVRILAWQGDRDSIAALQAMKTSAADSALIDWAIGKIQSQAFSAH
jgi:HEAT repeat protein